MLSKLILSFDRSEVGQVYPSFAEKLHGALMENLDVETANDLHQPGLKPYSQHLSFTKESINWHIHGLNVYAYERILQQLTDKDAFFLEALNKELQVQEKRLEQVTYDQFFKKFFLTEGDRKVSIRFRTATAFKRQGAYVNYPDLGLIIQSIVNKHDQFMPSTIFSEETMAHFLDHAELNAYRVQSARYRIGNVFIPGFIGNIEFYIKGPQQLVNLLNYMFQFAEYSGVGIKASLGMGSFIVEEK